MSTDPEWTEITEDEAERLVPYFAWDCHFCPATFGNTSEKRLALSIRRHIKAKHDGWEVSL